MALLVGGATGCGGGNANERAAEDKVEPAAEVSVTPPSAVVATHPATRPTESAAPVTHASANPSDDDKMQARNLFKVGVECFSQGDFRCADDAFTRAYRLVPAPGILYNLAQVRRSLGDSAGACKFAQEFINKDPAKSAERKQELLAICSTLKF
ncbi:MAG: hypothetical protein U0271_42670 [Polyangiaceae bacterium]